MTRIDHEWTSEQRTYGRFIRNFRREERLNFAGEQNGVEITRGATDRFNYNYAVGHTAVLSPSPCSTSRAAGCDSTTTCCRSTARAVEPGVSGEHCRAVPRLPADAALIASSRARTHGRRPRRHTWRAAERLQQRTAPAVLQHAVRRHADQDDGRAHDQGGLRLAQLRQTEINNGWRGGAYAFDGTYTRASSTAVSQFGQGIAAFLLGLPTNSSFIEHASGQTYEDDQPRLFRARRLARDDRLTLNLGVRYDLELGMTEAENRNVGRRSTSRRRIRFRPRRRRSTPRTRLRACRSPRTSSPCSAATPTCQTSRTGVERRSNNFQPRCGLHLQTTTTVLRGGAGLFIAPFQLQAVPGINTASISLATRATRRYR